MYKTKKLEKIGTASALPCEIVNYRYQRVRYDAQKGGDMKYVLCTTKMDKTGTKIGYEQEMTLLEATQLLQSETRNQSQTMMLLLDLRRNGWVSGKHGVIEWRKN